jgi:hypothetical protein
MLWEYIYVMKFTEELRSDIQMKEALIPIGGSH